MIGLSRPSMQAVSHRLALDEIAPRLEDINYANGPTLLLFLRHCGCPFAEATLRLARQLADNNPALQWVVLTHGDDSLAERWLEKIGGAGKLRHIHDNQRQHYGEWGLGYTPWQHFLLPGVLASVARLWPRGIINRKATGTRWQSAGAFLVDVNGRLKQVHYPQRADQLPPLNPLTGL